MREDLIALWEQASIRFIVYCAAIFVLGYWVLFA